VKDACQRNCSLFRTRKRPTICPTIHPTIHEAGLKWAAGDQEIDLAELGGAKIATLAGDATRETIAREHPNYDTRTEPRLRWGARGLLYVGSLVASRTPPGDTARHRPRSGTPPEPIGPGSLPTQDDLSKRPVTRSEFP